MEGDREALEHIARALEGRVLPGPGAVALPEPQAEAEALTLEPMSLKTLLEAMPAAIGILGSDGLIYANTAFAFAFGYRSPSELLEAGGLDAILPNGAPLTQDNGAERSAPIEALTRSRRKLKVAFALTALDGDVKLLRLIDQTSLEARNAARRASQWRGPRCGRRKPFHRSWKPTLRRGSSFSPRSATKCARRSTRSSALPS